MGWVVAMPKVINDVSARDLKLHVPLKSINFGEFVVVDISGGWSNITIRFLDTGFTCNAQISNIRRGTIKDPFKPTVLGVGFTGAKMLKGTQSNTDKTIISIWRSMLARCYSPKYQEIQPSYIGCSVDVRWHNLQNFFKWYVDNYPKDGKKYQLDKDIKVKGNKVYSPETCCFVTQEVNTQVANQKSYKVTKPCGKQLVVTNMNKFCRENKLQSSTMNAIAGGRYKSPFGWLVERL